MGDEVERTKTVLRVKDGQRILQFEGGLIGFSTSERPGAERWIEFSLYKTAEEHRYILSRVGHSKLYHVPECEIAERSRLDESPRADLVEGDVPCRECLPHKYETPFVSFEREKHWARVYDTPEAVIEGLMKRDMRTNAKYMTAVARRLLDDAGQVDDGVFEAISIETIR